MTGVKRRYLAVSFVSISISQYQAYLSLQSCVVCSQHWVPLMVWSMMVFMGTP